MPTVPRHLEFAPPPTPGLLRALGLAIVAHLVLLAVLSVGVQWKRDAVQETFEAELWASVPVQAAPPEPVPEPRKPRPPEPKPAPQPPAKPVPAPPDTSKAEADIALKKAKAKQLKKEKLALEKAELEKKKLAELEKEKQAKLEQDQKLEKRKKDRVEKQKKEEADKLTQAKDDAQRKQDLKDTQQLEDQRQKTIKRMAGLAGGGGNGAPGSTSTALEAKSLSVSYQGRIRAYIKRFHTYTETVSGNPTTEIEVRTSSDGSITSRKITKSSGTKSWDDAALNAIDKAEKLPLDENGRSPSPMTIIWSAQEVSR